MITDLIAEIMGAMEETSPVLSAFNFVQSRRNLQRYQHSQCVLENLD